MRETRVKQKKVKNSKAKAETQKTKKRSYRLMEHKKNKRARGRKIEKC